MRIRGFIGWALFILFLFYCMYAYKFRTAYNVDERDDQIEQQDWQLEVAKYAISLFPKKEKNEIFFNSIEQKYPNFKKDEELCNILGYTYLIEKKEQGEDGKGKDVKADKVTDNIIEFFKEN